MTGVPPIEDPYWFDDLADFVGPAYLRDDGQVADPHGGLHSYPPKP